MNPDPLDKETAQTMADENYRPALHTEVVSRVSSRNGGLLTSVCMICSRSRTVKFPACPSNELYDDVPCNDDGYP